MGKIDNTDLNNLLNKAIETKPDFVEPPSIKALCSTYPSAFAAASFAYALAGTISIAFAP